MRLKIDIKRFAEEPIIKPFHNHEIGFNVQGPSLIKVPEWIEDPLGIYYLYFADHKGDRINLAYSSNLRGPRNIYNGGVLHLNESNFLTLKPKVPEDFDLNTLEPIDVHDDLKEFISSQVSHDPKGILIGSMIDNPKVYGESLSAIPPSSMVLLTKKTNTTVLELIVCLTIIGP